MNLIISNYAQITANIATIQKEIQQRKNLFENEEGLELLVQLNHLDARYRAIYEIANFIDKQQRKLSAEIVNLERRHKIDVKVTETDELRGQKRQVTTLWDLTTKYKLEEEYKKHLINLIPQAEEIILSIGEIQQKLVEALQAKVAKTLEEIDSNKD